MTECLGRKTIITGHYGSGKTEFAISLALAVTKSCSPNKLAIIDLDIVNPYFRSREHKELLEGNGISVYGSTYDFEIGAEIPALSADVRTPLENREYKVIIDVGGNDAGALVLNQFSKYFTDDETTVLAVVNANRPETSEIEGIISHIKSIEKATQLTVSGIVNNTHLLRETTAEDIKYGFEICTEACGLTEKTLFCTCYPEGIINPDDIVGITTNLMPLGLHTRPTWLDK